MNSITPFSLEEKALSVHEARAAVLTKNISNSNTPQYKSADIDFKEALKQTSALKTNLIQTHPGHMSLSHSANGFQVNERTNVEGSENGNTVHEQQERAEFIDNAIRYQASLAFLKNKAQSLVKAIKGE